MQILNGTQCAFEIKEKLKSDIEIDSVISLHYFEYAKDFSFSGEIVKNKTFFFCEERGRQNETLPFAFSSFALAPSLFGFL